MNILILFIVVLWGLRIVFNILTYAHLWWVKEYRWDRMMIHLRTMQGKRILYPVWKRPPVTPKSLLVVLFSIGCAGYLLRTIPFHILLRFVIADALSFPITGCIVFMLHVPVKLYHEFLIAKAIQKLRTHKPMTVIGVTGSYGKTSTKEYLAAILSSRFRVLKTEASKNSPIGIAEVILKNLHPDHDMFVVEMGAYKRGEIARMTSMVLPQIGIITAINAQHQDLFGSLENTVNAKYELIEGLTGKNIAILNADNIYTKLMADRAVKDKKHVYMYSRTDEAGKGRRGMKHFLTAFDTESMLQSVRFTVKYGTKKKSISAPVVGEHQVSNILAALAGAIAAGMRFNDAVREVPHIRVVPNVMQIVKGMHGSVFINDTFNNNPDAAVAALMVLEKTRGKKYLVFQPMIELGSFAQRSHEDVGRKAGIICDEILLTNGNFYEDFAKGVRAGNPAVPVKVMSVHPAANELKQKVKRGDGILFKGKEAEAVFRRIIH